MPCTHWLFSIRSAPVSPQEIDVLQPNQPNTLDRIAALNEFMRSGSSSEWAAPKAAPSPNFNLQAFKPMKRKPMLTSILSEAENAIFDHQINTPGLSALVQAELNRLRCHLLRTMFEQFAEDHPLRQPDNVLHAAVRDGNIELYDAFVRQHGDSPLVRKLRRVMQLSSTGETAATGVCLQQAAVVLPLPCPTSIATKTPRA